MKKILAVIILILIMSLFSGCVSEDKEIIPTTREFVKDYIPNPETIQFNNETIIRGNFGCWDVFGSGTVEYEDSRQIFSYHIYVQEQDSKLKCVLKELKIGEV